MRGLPDNIRKSSPKFPLEWIGVGGLLVIFFILRLPFFSLPFWWDEMNHLQGALKIANNNFIPFVEWWSYHPPLVYEIVAFTHQFIGVWSLSARLTILSFSLLTIFFTYLTAKILYDRWVGFSALTMLMLSPIFFAQSGMFHLAIPLAALTAMTIYFYFSYKRKEKALWPYLVVASLLVLVKEPAILVILSIIFFETLLNFKNIFKKEVIVKLLLLSSPLLVFIVWIVVNKLTFGWFLWPYNLSYFGSNSPHETLGVDFILASVFWHDFRSLVSIPILLAGFFLLFGVKEKRKILSKELLFFLILAILSVGFFWWGPFLPRYLLFLYPFLFIVGAASLNFLIKNRHIFLIISLIINCLFILRWKESPIPLIDITNLHYLKRIEVHRQVAEFIEQDWSDYQILTHWPLCEELGFPEMGYVNQPLAITCLEEEIPRIDHEKILILVNEFDSRGSGLSKKLNFLLETEDLKLIGQFFAKWDRFSLYIRGEDTGSVKEFFNFFGEDFSCHLIS